MAALSYVMYDIIEKFLNDVIHVDWQKSPIQKLAIVGGIMINCDGDKTDCFLPLKFEIRQKGETPKDLF